MKQLLIFMGIFITIAITACTPAPSTPKLAMNESQQGGGNPEVLNHCFGLKKGAKSLCLDGFFPDNNNLLIHPNHGEAIMLAGRGEQVERRVLKLHNDDQVLLYLNIANVKVPLRSNIKESHFSYDKNTVVVTINAKEIKEKILLKDKEGNIVLDYRIER